MAEKYLNGIIAKFKTGKTTEHSFRGDLQDFVEKIAKDVQNNIQAINEPKRQKCGAPDYIVQTNNIPLGYIEAKDVDKSLDIVEKSDQLERYKASLENLILTNYLEFRFFINGEKTDTITIAEIQNGKIKVYEKEYSRLINRIKVFCVYEGQTVKSPKQLANLMAQKAVLIRDVIIKSLEDSPDNSLSKQRDAFKQILLHDLTDHTFADMYAQTIAYGLFVARLNDKTLEDFSRQEARELVSKNNPFLRQLFDYISGANLDENLIWIVEDLVKVFRAVNLNKLLQNYGKNTAMTDPFLHFYETFLENYDKVTKEKRGVYYTPLPVVEFIVKTVDDILKNEFSLKYGLADDSKIKYKKFLYKDNSKKGKGKEVFEEIETYKVQILDPATGTGTFLAEAVRKIYEYFVHQKGIWTQYVDKALIPRLNGFEIMMTPYVMCHLKLDYLLKDTEYITTNKTNRFNVYLTNALEKAETSQYPLFDWLSEEARQANSIKTEKPIMVIMGNPPYSGESANGSLFNDELAEYKKEWTGEKLKEKNPKWINDDYVKFIRLAQNFIDKNEEGVLAFMSNHALLDNPTFRGMRYSLLKSFDKIYILNLHGNSKKKECCDDGSKDENVFDIQQGVSINIFVKTGKKDKNSLAKIYYKSIKGLREDKFSYLSKNNINSVDFEELKPANPYYFFTPKDFSVIEEYMSGIPVNELFQVSLAGIVTARDNFCIKNSMEEVKKTIHNFVETETEYAREFYNLGDDVQDWKAELAKKDLINSGLDNNKIIQIAYRPFDTRWTYYTGKSKGFHCRPRNEVMKHFLNENIGISITKIIPANQHFSNIFIVSDISDVHMVGTQSYVCPLYLYDDSSRQQSFFDKKRKPNLNIDIIKEFEQKLNLKFVFEKEEKQGIFAPVDVFDYVYGILHSNKYREKFNEFLKIDFPRIPYPENTEYFFKISELGKQLREIHLMISPVLDEYITSYPVAGSNDVEKVEFKDNKVYINKTQYFDNVPETAWNFYIGGYQPAQKWLKDKKGYILDYENILHYQKIILSLTKTNEYMQEIDKIINFN